MLDVGAKPTVGTISCDIHKCNILILPMLPILYYQISFFESILVQSWKLDDTTLWNVVLSEQHSVVKPSVDFIYNHTIGLVTVPEDWDRNQGKKLGYEPGANLMRTVTPYNVRG